MSKQENMISKISSEAMLKAFEADKHNFMQKAEIVAKARKIIFDAYIKQGFTAEQAIQLCRE